MQCSCGGKTVPRTIQKDYEIITMYDECPACGRTLVIWDKERDGEHPHGSVKTSLNH